MFITTEYNGKKVKKRRSLLYRLFRLFHRGPFWNDMERAMDMARERNDNLEVFNASEDENDDSGNVTSGWQVTVHDINLFINDVNSDEVRMLSKGMDKNDLRQQWEFEIMKALENRNKGNRYLASSS